jgi:hypothetical protein
MLIPDVDLGILFGVGDDCFEAGDGNLLSDYFGEESEFDAEDRRDRDTICSLGGAFSKEAWESLRATLFVSIQDWKGKSLVVLFRPPLERNLDTEFKLELQQYDE